MSMFRKPSLTELYEKDPRWIEEHLTPRDRAFYEAEFRRKIPPSGEVDLPETYWVTMNIAKHPAQFLIDCFPHEGTLLALLANFMTRCQRHENCDYLEILADNRKLLEKFFRYLPKEPVKDGDTVEARQLRLVQDMLKAWGAIPAELYQAVMSRGLEFAKSAIQVVTEQAMKTPWRLVELPEQLTAGEGVHTVAEAASDFLLEAVKRFDCKPADAAGLVFLAGVTTNPAEPPRRFSDEAYAWWQITQKMPPATARSVWQALKETILKMPDPTGEKTAAMNYWAAQMDNYRFALFMVYTLAAENAEKVAKLEQKLAALPEAERPKALVVLYYTWQTT